MLTVLISIAILLFLVAAHEFGHFTTAKLSGVRVDEFGFGFPPKLVGKKLGETEYSLNLLPFGAFVRIPGEEDPKVKGGLASRSPGTRLLVMGGGALVNILIAFVLFTAALMIPKQVVVGGQEVQIKRIMPDTPAAQAGLQVNDIILIVNGQAVKTTDDMRQLITANLGSEITLYIQREPDQQLGVKLVPRPNPPQGQGAMGVELGYAIVQTETQADPIWEAVPQAVQQTLYIPVLVKDALVQLFVRRDLTGIGGPVGIVQTTGEVATRFGFVPLIEWTGVISMGLGLTQLLPFPMLDGGRMVFVLLEIIRRGKRIPAEREGLVHLIGFMVLISLMILVTYNDILRIINGQNILP